MPENSSSSSLIDTIDLPENFKIELFADNIEGARSMDLGGEDILFVGSRDAGKVYAVKFSEEDYKSGEVIIIDEGLNSPNGVAYKDGDLYVAEISRVIRYKNIENRLNDLPEPEVINDNFPDDAHHGWKYIAFGPDGKLYVPVGAPCNICKSEDSIYASVTRMDPDGSGHEIFARGIRNTVGFDWHPESGELWFTDNGRDRMGDNKPPDELNKAPEKGLHFGYPFCHGDNLPDPEFGDVHPCDQFIAPEQKLGPHVAALGMLFYTGNSFPAEYNGDIFIAEHGSWNRSVPIGYRITRVPVENGKAAGYEIFAEGWLNEDGDHWGRPVDVIQLPDGSILVSDDYGGRIYRIFYEK